jgi:putative tricarboxylic transport membrane protein
MATSRGSLYHTLIGLGVLIIAAGLAYGAMTIPSASGYAGVGPNFLPWLVASVLLICGAMLIWEARSGGFRQLDAPSGAAKGDWRALGWVSAGVLANAALITGFELPQLGIKVPGIGFVLSCALCFVLAVRGLRSSQGVSAGNAQRTLLDALTGLLIAAPVYWLFTKVLSINLPGLTASGWL